MVLLPQGLKALQQVTKQVGLDLRGAYRNLDGGFDSITNRKCIFNADLIPNIPENPRHRKHTKRGRKRLFNTAIRAPQARARPPSPCLDAAHGMRGGCTNPQAAHLVRVTWSGVHASHEQEQSKHAWWERHGPLDQRRGRMREPHSASKGGTYV